MTSAALGELVGGTDIYLLDQIIKGRITSEMSVLDAGCGAGRNLRYLARVGAEVWGVDESSEAVEGARRNVGDVAKGLPPERFACRAVEDLDFPKGTFDVVICNAVLHFSRDGAHFNAMVEALWRALKVGGLFFTRLASSIGIEDRVEPMASAGESVQRGVGWFALPDGSKRFLVDERFLVETAARLVSILGPELEIQIVTLITAFGIALVKANLVIRHFMHLSIEKPIIKWLLAASVVLIALMWSGIAPDVQNHEGHQWENLAAQAAVARGISEPGAEHEEEAETHVAETASVAGVAPALPGPLPGGYNFTHLVFWSVVGLVAVGTNAVAIILSFGAGLLALETFKGDDNSG